MIARATLYQTPDAWQAAERSAAAASAETTQIIRRHHRQPPRLADEDIVDEADRIREARTEGWNAALELAASLMKLRGQREDAALIRRQKKEII